MIIVPPPIPQPTCLQRIVGSVVCFLLPFVVVALGWLVIALLKP
jgi:hypothetical protein